MEHEHENTTASQANEQLTGGASLNMGGFDPAFLLSWMSKLPDDQSLSALSIPGTHESGTEKTGAGPAHCQNFNIARQLNDGIRFLDIRVSTVNRMVDPNDPLKIKHGIVDCWITFDDVITWCRNFLRGHPSETIIMIVDKADDKLSGPIEDAFELYCNKQLNKNLFYLETSIPTLGKARGKIVLFRRFSVNDAKRGRVGVDLQDNWKNNATFDLTTRHGVKFHIEDEYKQYNTNKKVTTVRNALQHATTTASDIFHITFNSIAWGPGHHTPFQYAWGGVGVNPAMNPALRDKILPGVINKKNRFGAVLLDFHNNGSNNNIDNRIVEKLILSNFG